MSLLSSTDAASHAAAAMTDERSLPDVRRIAQPLEELSADSVFVVGDALACRHSGAEAALAEVLECYRTSLFQEFEPNPKFDDLKRGLDLFRRSPADVVLAVGGGTAIDLAKLIALFAVQSADPRALILRDEEIAGPPVPLIAVPTTSGTGSEATQFAVIYMEPGGDAAGEGLEAGPAAGLVKHSVDHPGLMPNWCVLDPRLTATLPPAITAQTGLDAFCQAVESLWSVRSSGESARYATEAMQLVLSHLNQAVHAPTPAARAAMCRASHLAGRAINLTRTTAPHAISYAITSDYGIPHGHAVALTLGPMLVYNAGVTGEDVNDPRGVDHVRRTVGKILGLLGCTNPEEGRRRIQHFVESLDCKSRLGELGISGEEALRSIGRKVNAERLNNNPRRLTAEQLVALLRSIG